MPSDARRGHSIADIDVSYCIASYNSQDYLAGAVASALRQRDVVAEIIIVDDKSTDGSDRLAQELAAAHPTVSVVLSLVNRGPAGARNQAIERARGRWFGVLDCDDLLHPDRSRRMIDHALATDADLVGDDLILFTNDMAEGAKPFLSAAQVKDHGISLERYLRETRMYGPSPNLGFLKPLIRTGYLNAHDLRYDERLRIAEDDDLILRCLIAGGRYTLLPQPCYFYRKHEGSTSNRLRLADIDQMKLADERMAEARRASSAPVRAAWRSRSRAMRRAWAFSHWIDAVKGRQWRKAAAIVARTPSAMVLLRLPIAARLGRILRSDIAPPWREQGGAKALALVSRQRLMGSTNGSSAYLIEIAKAATAEGYAVSLLQPSPGLFGRTPFFRFGEEMGVFKSIRVRGGFRIGSWLVTNEASVWMAALRGVVARIARRAGVSGGAFRERKAPYAVAMPWTRDDRRFIAAHAGLQPDVIIADYVFQTEAFPYLLRPGARTATVLHDLFHTRSAQFTGARDSVALLGREEEISLIGRGDAALAIQQDEAAFVRDHVPETTPLLVPMPARPVTEAAVGDDATLLFVGSDTAPNVLGLQWFIDHVWPLVRAARPDTRLLVAGTVSSSMTGRVPGIEYLGRVPQLAALYRRAGVVISPLRQGSGLKIKLVEALAHGKAAVATSTTLQGVDWLSERAVLRADSGEDFAAAISGLQDDRSARAALAGEALAAAGRFGVDQSMQAFRDWLRASGA